MVTLYILQELCQNSPGLDEFSIDVIDSPIDTTRELLSVLYSLIDGRELDWSEAVANPVVHDNGARYRFHRSPSTIIP